MPPESSRGSSPSTPSRPTDLRTLATWVAMSAQDFRLCSRIGRPTFSSTVIESSSAPFWNSIPMPLRISPSSRSLVSDSRCPATRTSPESGRWRPPTIRSSVLLPVPLPPSSRWISPLRMRHDIPSKTVRLPKASRTSRSSMKASGSRSEPVAADPPSGRRDGASRAEASARLSRIDPPTRSRVPSIPNQ